MKKSRIKAIIFDLDGTLLDTDRLIWAGYQHVFSKYRPDYTLTAQDLLEVLGPPLKDIFPKYFQEDVHQLIADYRDFCNSVDARDYVSLCPGVLETLTYLKANGYKLGIVTTKFVAGAQASLRDFHLEDHFDVIVGLDSVTQHKPHPEGVITALKRLNVQAEEALFIGDNVSDIQAGKGANVTSIAIGWSKKGVAHLQKAKPYTILHDMYTLIDVIKELDEHESNTI